MRGLIKNNLKVNRDQGAVIRATVFMIYVYVGVRSIRTVGYTRLGG